MEQNHSYRINSPLAFISSRELLLMLYRVRSVVYVTSRGPEQSFMYIHGSFLERVFGKGFVALIIRYVEARGCVVGSSTTRELEIHSFLTRRELEPLFISCCDVVWSDFANGIRPREARDRIPSTSFRHWVAGGLRETRARILPLYKVLGLLRTRRDAAFAVRVSLARSILSTEPSWIRRFTVLTVDLAGLS